MSSSQEAVSQWQETVSSHLPHLSRPQAKVLALWSYALIFVHHSGMTMVGAWLAQLVGGTEDAWRQRLREWCYDAQDKKGSKRAQLEVAECFGPLLGWILDWWPASEKRLALALDASTLSDRFTVLSISVVYRGCAIPVAWHLVVAGEKGAWKPYWLALVKSLQGYVPVDWTVIVMADRGLYARWLYREIQELGWHPFLRINLNGKVRPAGAKCFQWLSTLVPERGQTWCGNVTCFADPSQWLVCTLLAQWDSDHADPWLVITDLEVPQAEIAWYGMRFWIECGFKDHKRGGWHWHLTKMTHPRRAERLWLVQVVALIWTVSVGGFIDANLPASSLADLPANHIARRLDKERVQPRRLSCLSRGLIAISVAAVKGMAVPTGCFVPFLWPTDAICSPALQSQGRGP
jgi:hypothetical protein